eukprot:scaffold139_cov260-Ochromonas_danica.AAC.1
MRSTMLVGDYFCLFILSFIFYSRKTYAGVNYSVSTVLGVTDKTISELNAIENINSPALPMGVATLTSPQAYHFVGTTGSYYIADSQYIRKYDQATGLLSIYAGGGGSLSNSVTRMVAKLHDVRGITGDTLGNIYYSEYQLCVVKMIYATTGRVQTIAGRMNNCTYDPNARVTLSSPLGIFYSPLFHKIYIAESGAHTVRALDLTTGSASIVLGEGGIAGASIQYPLSTQLYDVVQVYVDSRGRLYSMEKGGNRILRSTLGSDGLANSSLTVELMVGGSGPSNDGSPANQTSIMDPICFGVDSQDNIFLVENGNSIRRVLSHTGLIETISDSSASLLLSGVSLRSLGLVYVHSCTIDTNGSFVFASSDNYNPLFALWSVKSPTTSDPLVYSINSYVGGVERPANYLELSRPPDIWIDQHNNLFVSDAIGNVIHKVEVYRGLTSIYAGAKNSQGGTYTGSNSLATMSLLSRPLDVVGDLHGNLYINDVGNTIVRKVVSDTGILIDLVGSIGVSCDGSWSTDSTGAAAVLCQVTALAIDAARNILYIAEGSFVRKYDIGSDLLQTVVGNDQAGDLDGAIAVSTFSNIVDMWVDSASNLFVADHSAYSLIRYVNFSSSSVATYAGCRGSMSMNYDGVVATAIALNAISHICGDEKGNLFFVDLSFGVRMIDSITRNVSSVVGNKTLSEGESEFVPPTNAIGWPGACSVDLHGNLYFAENVSSWDIIRVREKSIITMPTSRPSSTPTSQPTEINLGPLTIIHTYGGYTSSSFDSRGDGGPSQYAAISTPRGITQDSTGDIYFAEGTNIRKIFASNNTIITLAGGGESFNDHISGTLTAIRTAYGIAVDGAGVVYYSDADDNKVRIILTNQTVVTIAGNGTAGFSGDEGPATSAMLNNPQGIFYHASSHSLFIADSGNCLIRKVELDQMVIKTFAGNGTCSAPTNNVSALLATSIGQPIGIWIDSLGDLYFTENSGCGVHKIISSSNWIIRIAGSGSCIYNGVTEGPITSVSIARWLAITGDNHGNIFASGGGLNGVRVINTTNNTMTLLTASSTSSLLLASDYPVKFVRSGAAYGCHYDNQRNTLLATDSINNMVWKVDMKTQRIYSVVGFINNVIVYPATSVSMTSVIYLWMDTNDAIYLSDQDRHQVLKLTKTVGDSQQASLSIVAGAGLSGYNGDNQLATLAALNTPKGICGDNVGNLYVAEQGGYRIRKLYPNQTITTIAGTGIGCTDPSPTTFTGPATSLHLCGIRAITIDRNGSSLYFVDRMYMIRMVDLFDGSTITIAGSSAAGLMVNVPPIEAVYGEINDVWMDNMNRLFVSDASNSVVHLIDFEANKSSIFVGVPGQSNYNGEGWPSTLAHLSNPGGLCGDSIGNIFVPNLVNGGGLMVVGHHTNRLYTFSGNHLAGLGGEFVSATSASTGYVYKCVADRNGGIYYTEGSTTIGNRVRYVNVVYPTSAPSSPPAPIFTRKVKTVGGFTRTFYNVNRGDGGPLSEAILYNPIGVYIDTSNNMYIAEFNYLRVVNGTTNIISTLAGGGSSSASGISGQNVIILSAYGVAGDENGNIFFSDRGRNQILAYRPSTQLVYAIAGEYGVSGYNGDSDLAIYAHLNTPCGLFYHPKKGYLYFVDRVNAVIRYIDVRNTSKIYTLNLVFPAQIAPASLSGPLDIWVDVSKDLLFVTDTAFPRILRVDLLTSNVTTFAGTGSNTVSALIEGVMANQTAITFAKAICGDAQGNIYFGQQSNSGYYGVDPNGKLFRAAGMRLNILLASNISAREVFIGSNSGGCKVDQIGNLIITDATSSNIRRGTIWKVNTPKSSRAVVELMQGFANGVRLPATSVFLNHVVCIWGDTMGDLFISEYEKSSIYKIRSLDQTVEVFAGTGRSLSGYNNRLATLTPIQLPYGIVGDTLGSVYFADYGGNLIRKVEGETNLLTTIAGTGSCDSNWNGYGVATAQTICSPSALAMDEVNNQLYISDGRYVIKKLDLTLNYLQTVVGTGINGFVDLVPPAEAHISIVYSMWLNNQGHLFLADNSNNVVRKVDFAVNFTSTVVGARNGGQSMINDYSYLVPAMNVKLVSVMGICGDESREDIYILDKSNSTLMLHSSYLQLVMGSGGVQQFDGEFVEAAGSFMGEGLACFVNKQGDIYISENLVSEGMSRIRVLSEFAPSSQPSSQPTSEPTAQPSERNLGASTFIDTFAGYKKKDGLGGGNALAATFLSINAICEDTLGNIYVADDVFVRKISVLNNTVVTYAGGGSDLNENIPATTASFNSLHGIVIGPMGFLYISESDSNRVRTIDPITSLVRTTIGSGTQGYDGDGGPAIQAKLNYPRGLFLDAIGRAVYIADSGNAAIRRYDFNMLTISTIAGGSNNTMLPMTNVLATMAYIGNVVSVWKASTGGIYFSEMSTCRIFVISSNTSMISTVAGSGSCSSNSLPDEGAATSISLSATYSLTGDTSGNIYFSPFDGSGVRKINTVSGMLERITASASSLLVGTNLPGRSVKLSGGFCFFNSNGSLRITENNVNHIWDWNPDSRIVKVISGFVPGVTLPATAANLGVIYSIAAGSNDELYVVQYQNQVVNQIQQANTYALKRQNAVSLPTISIIAGTGLSGYNGDNQAASLAALASPRSVVVDSLSNIYIVDFSNKRIRKIEFTTMNITTVMGTGVEAGACSTASAFYTGPATSLSLCNPSALAIDKSGNIYSSDSSLFVIRKLSLATGMVTTVAGNGTRGFRDSLTEGLTYAKFTLISTILSTHEGNLYAIDSSNNCVLYVNFEKGTVTTAAGQCTKTGALIDGVAATSSFLSRPYGGCLDDEGNLYIMALSGGINSVVRYHSQRIYHFIGNGSNSWVLSAEGVPALSSSIGTDYACTVVRGQLYFTDSVGSYSLVRRAYSVYPTSPPTSPPLPQVTKLVKTLAGFTKHHFMSRGDGGLLKEAFLTNAKGIHLDTLGDIYLTDDIYVRRVDHSSSIIYTLVGGGTNISSGVPMEDVLLRNPRGISGDTSGTIYFLDQSRCQVLSLRDGIVYVIAGSYMNCSDSGDGGPAVNALLNLPSSIFCAVSINALFVADKFNSKIRVIDLSNGVINSLSPIFAADDVQNLFRATDIWIDPSSNYGYIADTLNGLVRQVDLSSRKITTVAGNGTTNCVSSNGVKATSTCVYFPQAVCGDSSGNIYITQRDNNGVLRIDTDGYIWQVAGVMDVNNFLLASGVPATTVGVGTSLSCKVDYHSGSLYFTDNFNCINHTGFIWRIAQPLQANATIELVTGFVGNMALPATAVSFSYISSIWSDSQNNVYIADSKRLFLSKLSMSTQLVSVVAGVGLLVPRKDNIAATLASISPSAVVGDSQNNLYVAESTRHLVRKIVAQTGMISTVVGSGFCDVSNIGGGPATAVNICGPYALAMDQSNDALYITDSNFLIRRLSLTTGYFSTMAGIGTAGYLDGFPTSALLGDVRGLWVSSVANKLFLTDWTNKVIRAVNFNTNRLNTIAGGGSIFNVSELVPVQQYEFRSLQGICGDSMGNIYIPDENAFNQINSPGDYVMRLMSSWESSIGDEYVEADNSPMGTGLACHVNKQGDVLLSELTSFSRCTIFYADI